MHSSKHTTHYALIVCVRVQCKSGVDKGNARRPTYCMCQQICCSVLGCYYCVITVVYGLLSHCCQVLNFVLRTIYCVLFFLIGQGLMQKRFCMTKAIVLMRVLCARLCSRAKSCQVRVNVIYQHMYNVRARYILHFSDIYSQAICTYICVYLLHNEAMHQGQKRSV